MSDSVSVSVELRQRETRRKAMNKPFNPPSTEKPGNPKVPFEILLL